ncbi:MAG TPA: hypothetical protein VHT30_11680 [Acidimicrobiales bacterium]|nr:hypothetical protein [Acidimicrobiales bacterium]
MVAGGPVASVVDAREAVLRTAWRRDQRPVEGFAANLALLPDAVAAHLIAAAAADKVAAAVLADMLAAGRSEPGLTATALLGGSPGWLSQSSVAAELWDAVGSYLDEHEFQLDAGRAFFNAASARGPKAPGAGQSPVCV